MTDWAWWRLVAGVAVLGTLWLGRCDAFGETLVDPRLASRPPEYRYWRVSPSELSRTEHQYVCVTGTILKISPWASGDVEVLMGDAKHTATVRIIPTLPTWSPQLRKAERITACGVLNRLKGSTKIFPVERIWREE